ncbi:MAG: hypothetical protein ACRDHF_08380 [Tepidiformaceae bacterium]
MRKLLHGRGQRLTAAFLIGLIFSVVAAQAARAQEPPSSTTAAPLVGYDISWPQCDGPYPRNYASIGIIGINGGKPFTENRCLASQWDWLGQYSQRDAVYINLDYFRTVTVHQLWGPAGFCTLDDLSCRTYNHGWNSARDALVRAKKAGVKTDEWWLDVETMNHWSDSKGLNERVIAGAIEYLQSKQLNVGIYSTPYQWGVIAGGYMPGLPVWTAGAENFLEAVSRCNNPKYEFGGGKVALVQYVQTYDTNVICY